MKPVVRGKPRDVIARVVRELMLGGPANVTSLAKIIWGAARFRRGVAMAIETMRTHGVVRVHSWDANGFAVYEMQKTPGALPDMPRPLRGRDDLKTVPGRAPKRFSVGGELLTVRQIAQREGLNDQVVRKRLRAKEEASRGPVNLGPTP